MPDPVRPRCSIVPVAQCYSEKVVRYLRFDGADLVVDIQGQGLSFAHVVFRNVVGFRVLDERDLCEFWPDYSEPHGWLWEVESGGWVDLERHRPLFNSHEFCAPLREFLICDNKCISILCAHPPEIQTAGCAPTMDEKT
jgi:hypothetical protein